MQPMLVTSKAKWKQRMDNKLYWMYQHIQMHACLLWASFSLPTQQEGHVTEDEIHTATTDHYTWLSDCLKESENQEPEQFNLQRHWSGIHPPPKFRTSWNTGMIANHWKRSLNLNRLQITEYDSLILHVVVSRSPPFSVPCPFKDDLCLLCLRFLHFQWCVPSPRLHKTFVSSFMSRFFHWKDLSSLCSITLG